MIKKPIDQSITIGNVQNALNPSSAKVILDIELDGIAHTANSTYLLIENQLLIKG